MRLPNGFGSISKLSGNRRKPYVVRKSAVSFNGKRKLLYLGTFETYDKAIQFLSEYNKEDKPQELITFARVYTLWLKNHSEHVSKSAVDGYKNSFRHITPIISKPISQVKYSDLQALIDDMKNKGFHYSSLKKVRSLLNMLYDYAIVNEWCDKKLSEFLVIGKNEPINPHSVYTRQQINKLWRSDNPNSALPLILLYTGMRSKELRQLKKSDIKLKQKFIDIKQSKTKAGIRIIPIHERILPLVRRLMTTDGKYLLGEYEMTYERFANKFNEVMQEENIKHTTHDCRHTFATLLSNANANEVTRRRLLGHASNNVTDAVYTHKALPQLRQAIKLLR